MKAVALDPSTIAPDRVAGRVLCHDVVVAGDTGRVKLPKGRILDRADAAALRLYPGEVHLLELGSGDVHEDEASRRLARAVSGEGVTIRPPVESQSQLRAAHRGLVEVDAGALQAINSLPDISVFTVYDGQPVDIDRVVGATKVTPLAVPEDVLRQAEHIARDAAPVLRVRPFLKLPVGVLVRDRITARARDTFEAAIQTKLSWFGSPIAGIAYLPDDVDAIACALSRFVQTGARLILAAGVNSTDPLDLTLQALERVGAETERRGVPAHPGSTCWLAYIGQVPVFGLALCGMFSQTTVLDLLLPRFLAGCDVRGADIARFGHGGLLSKEMAFRFPPYAVAG
ncbi:MAG TPA: molybdopterin-binding protein [Chloroflexota bacterium]|nr:molybdopterin-binding protein [Chloroflexota bacterium]